MHDMMYDSVRLYGRNKLLSLITASHSQQNEDVGHSWALSLIQQLRKTEEERRLWREREYTREEWKLVWRQDCLPCGLVCLTAGDGWLMTQFIPVPLTLERGLGGDLLGMVRWCMEREREAFKIRDSTRFISCSGNMGRSVERFTCVWEPLGAGSHQLVTLILLVSPHGCGIIDLDWLADVH